MRTMHEELNARIADALDAYKGFLSQATNGLLDCELSEHRGVLRVFRTDGKPLGEHTAFGETTPISGVITSIYLGSIKINRSHKRKLRELRDEIRSILVKYDLLEEPGVINALCAFEYNTKIGY